MHLILLALWWGYISHVTTVVARLNQTRTICDLWTAKPSLPGAASESRSWRWQNRNTVPKIQVATNDFADMKKCRRVSLAHWGCNKDSLVGPQGSGCRFEVPWFSWFQRLNEEIRSRSWPRSNIIVCLERNLKLLRTENCMKLLNSVGNEYESSKTRQFNQVDKYGHYPPTPNSLAAVQSCRWPGHQRRMPHTLYDLTVESNTSSTGSPREGLPGYPIVTGSLKIRNSKLWYIRT